MTGMLTEIQIGASAQVLDAVAFLTTCHEDVIGLFGEYEQTNSIIRKKNTATKICNDLKAHIQLEEEIFFPAIKDFVKEKSELSLLMLNNSILRYLINELESIDVDSSVFDIKIHVLYKHVQEQLWEKQRKVFAQLVAAEQLDLWSLGAELVRRKEELTAQYTSRTFGSM